LHRFRFCSYLIDEILKCCRFQLSIFVVKTNTQRRRIENVYANTNLFRSCCEGGGEAVENMCVNYIR